MLWTELNEKVQEYLDVSPFNGTPEPGQDGKYHYVYCIINSVNKKFYIGWSGKR